MSSSQYSILERVLPRIKDPRQRSTFQRIQITQEQVNGNIHFLKGLDNSQRRQHLEEYSRWIKHHTSLFEDFELDLDDICDFFDFYGEETDGDTEEAVFCFSALYTWMHLHSTAPRPQEEHKAQEVEFSQVALPDTIKFEIVIDVHENMLFHDGLLFLTSDRDLETLWRILLPDQTGIPGKPIFQRFQEHHQRPRRQTKSIQTLYEDMPTNSPSETPLLTDGFSFTSLYGMVNGLLHQVSMSPEFSGDFVAFSVAATFKGASHLPEWFNSSVKRSPRITEQEMIEWNTMEWSGLFGRLFAATKTDKRWFVMRKINRRIRAKVLLDAMGFDQISRPNRHDKMTEIAQNWKCDYITLYVWRVGSPRVYLDFNGFRVRVRSTLDVRVILNSICRVIQIDTTDSDYNADVREVVNRLVARPTTELIEKSRITRMIFMNQDHFLQARREMEDRVASRCFSTLSPGKDNITEDTTEVGKMDDPVFDSIERVIQSRPDFIENSFAKVANSG